ncbi:TraR/DksA C4-type zinc finger protein [Streptomyces sp. TRM76323]|uniref:TraR/DksA C4-type zinc finger protein n=1 Tax=Streptomyces tamarix TaxID=3078565 RepID=A0ABU3QRW2_9ACTN|nr:TraR/DksA C4-type zinc finger protein [Streptomyces tamarix]MDT9685346.1 TraR/DksA C4-type zinc finger protein [Streptomyces tamarix]
MSNRTARADDAGLTAEDVAALRQNLQEQRRFRLEQLARMARTAPGSRDGAAARREVRAELTASARMVLHDVEEALERMDRGRYGTCRLCGGPIGLRRLTIVPQARYCGHCHRAREAHR